MNFIFVQPTCGEGYIWILLQFLFGVYACVVHACVRMSVRPSELVRAKTSTFMHGFQNNLAQLLSLRSTCAI